MMVTEQPSDGLVFSVDPGSCRCGWCCMKPKGEFVDGGVLLPNNFRASADIRIKGLCEDLEELLFERKPKVVLLEWSSGDVGRKRHRGAGAYLSIYGIAVGAIWQTILTWRKSLPEKQQSEVEVVLVDEILWTGGIPKFMRCKVISDLYSGYDVTKDKGMDLSDAIGICLWYLKEQKIRSGKFDVGKGEKK